MTRQKVYVTMVAGGNWTYCNHFAMYNKYQIIMLYT